MKSLKHIGKVVNTGSKVLVVFRTLPGESNKSLVLPVSTLPDMYHDAIMTLVETDQAQDAFEFGETMFMRHFPDGRPMLQAMQADGRLVKVETKDIIMTPTFNDQIVLSELNVLIAEQKNCAVDELCTFVNGGNAKNQTKKPDNPAAKAYVEATPAPVVEPLSDTDIAKSYRSQADAMYKEAARLRKQADDLDPPKKKAAKSEATESADA
jgi:hypothetical protein